MSNRVITKARAIRDVTANPSLLKNYGEFKDDRKVVNQALRISGLCLRYASDRLKDDKRMVRLALRQQGESLKYASDRLKDDSKMVYEALYIHPRLIAYASKRFRNNSKDLMRILLRFPRCYEFLDFDQQSNFLIQLQTMRGLKDIYHQKKPFIRLLLKNLIVSMHENKSRVLIILKRGNADYPIRMASLFARVKNTGVPSYEEWVANWSDDKEIMIGLIKQNISDFSLASEQLRSDPDFFAIALKESVIGPPYGSYSPFKDSSKEFCDSRDLSLQAIPIHMSYKYLSARLRADEEIASKYFCSSQLHSRFIDLGPVPYSIRKQPHFIHWYLRSDGHRVKTARHIERLLKQDANPIVIFSHCNDYIRSLKNIYIPAINESPNLVRYLQNLETLLKFDYTNLNTAAREKLYERYLYLQGKFKTTEVDLFNRATEEIRVKKMMCINPIS